MDKRQCGGITQREGKQVNWALQLPRLPTYRCFLHQEETQGRTWWPERRWWRLKSWGSGDLLAREKEATQRKNSRNLQGVSFHVWLSAKRHMQKVRPQKAIKTIQERTTVAEAAVHRTVFRAQTRGTTSHNGKIFLNTRRHWFRARKRHGWGVVLHLPYNKGSSGPNLTKLNKSRSNWSRSK